MSAMPKQHKLTVDEYFAIEEKAERKSEFFNGEMFLVAGASRQHNALTRNLTAALHLRLMSSNCRVFVADQRVKIDRTGLYTYPDLLIVCGTPEYASENPNTLTNPKVVIEVLSNSTERYDRTTKFRQYKKLNSVQEYVLVSQDEPLIERFTRQSDGTWAQTDFVGMDVDMTFATVKASVPLSEVYFEVEFPDSPNR